MTLEGFENVVGPDEAQELADVVKDAVTKKAARGAGPLELGWAAETAVMEALGHPEEEDDE